MTVSVPITTKLLEIQLLGGFAVDLGGQRVPDATWRRRKAASLIKLLALEPAHRLHRDQVMDALWPELDAVAADNNLRFTLHEARKRLASAGAGREDFLTRAGETLVLGPAESVSVDVDRFEQAAAAAWLSDDPALTRTALALYRGDLLLDDAYEAWTESRRATLRASYLALHRRLADLLQARGEKGAAQATLEQVVALDPFDELSYVALMRSLASTGHRQGALDRYNCLAATLQQELGADPEPETTRLRDEIASGRFRPVSDDTSSEQPTPDGRALATALPASVDRFIGREREVAELSRLLMTARLVTLTGPGGVGKTRLALEAGRGIEASFANDVIFVDLAPLRDPGLVLPAIAHARGLRDDQRSPVLAQLSAALGDRRMLLLLDNVEHLLPAARDVAELLAAVPGLTVLATSRERLRLRGEWEYRVSPLALPEPVADSQTAGLRTIIEQSPAVALFVDRAGAHAPAFALTEAHAHDVAGICRHLDGLPLALELAATWTKLLSPAAIVDRVERGRLSLTGGPRDLPQRQQTIRATIAWSYDLLTPPQQRLFRRLGVFVGGWTIEAAAAVIGADATGPDEVLDPMLALVDQSLLVGHAQPDGTTRFTMLETIREFAVESLNAEEDVTDIRRRHAEYFLGLSVNAAPHLAQSEQVEWYSKLESEHANIREAIAYFVTHGRFDDVLRIAESLWIFWFDRHAAEASTWLRAALEAGGTDPKLRANALHGAGNLARALGDPIRGEAYHQEELALRQAMGDEGGLGKTLLPLGVEAFERDDLARACSTLDESLSRLRETSDTWALGIALVSRAHVAWELGDYELARQLLDEGIAVHAARGDQFQVVRSLPFLAGLSLATGDVAQAQSYLEDSLKRMRALGIENIEGYYAWNGLAYVAILQGNLDRAEQYVAEASVLAKDLPPDPDFLLTQGQIARLRGNPNEAAIAYAQALPLVRDAEYRPLATAMDYFHEVADFGLELHQLEPAAQLLSFEIVLRQRTGRVREVLDRADHERRVSSVTEQLSPDTWTALMRRAEQMSNEQIIAAGLDVSTELLTSAKEP